MFECQGVWGLNVKVPNKNVLSRHLVLLWIMTDITYLLGAAQQANSSACQVKKERKKKTDRQTDRNKERKK